MLNQHNLLQIGTYGYVGTVYVQIWDPHCWKLWIRIWDPHCEKCWIHIWIRDPENTLRYWMFRAVAPNARENHDAAERRRQMIQESKYLGGDMEHTHLVKGLDFALLQKVRYQRFKVSVFGTVPYTLGYQVRCRYPTSEYDILYFKTWIYILSRILPYLSHISVHLRSLFYL